MDLGSPLQILSWRASSYARQGWKTVDLFLRGTRESKLRGWKDASDATRTRAIVQPGSNDLAASTRLITAPRPTNNRRAAIAKSGVQTPRSNVCALHVIRCNYAYTRGSFHHRVACSSRVNINSVRSLPPTLLSSAHFHFPSPYIHSILSRHDIKSGMQRLFKQKSKGKKNCSQGTEACRTEKRERERRSYKYRC